MNLRTTAKYLGLALCIIGLFISIISLITGPYTFEKRLVRESGQGEKYDLLETITSDSNGEIFKNSFQFVGFLDNKLNKINFLIDSLYGINNAEIKKIAAFTNKNDTLVFSISHIDSVLISDDSYTAFKRKILRDYSGWMDNKSYQSIDLLIGDLSSSMISINNNLKYEKGFSDYEIKQLKFIITKHANASFSKTHSDSTFLLTIFFIALGGLLYVFGKYYNRIPGIKNDNIFKSSHSSVGWIGIFLGSLMIGFYIVLYFFPEYITGWVLLVDPISYFLNGSEASHWFLYGFLYTMAIIVMGIRMILKYKGNPYQITRTFSVIFFQTAFAFIIPEILISLNKPGYDFKNIWPLDYDFFYSYNLDALTSSGNLGWFMLFWGLVLIIIAVPILTYFLGKRWYCSWVCGCGGLAETLGDPFRQLSNKSLKAWKIERWLIHGVMVFAIINTAGVLYTYFTESYSFIGISTETVKTSYGFLISSIFAGVIGTGFYPLMGNRVWCRFGCPLAAYLGIVQRFKSRFRITTNGGQCISCGNCSTYCEMGIDVRWYAQRGQNIVRSSCVGCGICSAVCPRGVLKLENKETKNRINIPTLIGHSI